MRFESAGVCHILIKLYGMLPSSGKEFNMYDANEATDIK